MSFPKGAVGACHPFNIQKFDLQGDCLHLYERATGLPEEEWEPRISSLHRFAVQVQNCSTVQQCGLGMLFLNTGAMLTPGYDATAGGDYWRLLYWTQMQRRVSALQRRRLLHWLRVVRVSNGGGRSNPAEVHPKAEEVTIGIHADQKSAKGPWRGQLNAWQAFAEMHGHRFLLDLERHFTGTVFARYLGLFWASSTDSDDGFWSQYSFLRPSGDVSAIAHSRPQGNQVPDGSFLDATLDDPKLLEKLRIFNQPPGFWDSLEALAASVSKSPWTVWIDFDLTISPCCFDSFAFTNLIGRTKDGGLPHVVIRDSPHEDYHHHCANAGFVIVRNSSIGRLFVEMAKEKRPWPSIPYGYQSALAESLLELLGLEAETFGDTPERYRSECLHHLTLGRPLGDTSYANYCRCWRSQLDRFAGLQRDGSRWVQFLLPRQGPEMGFLLASTFLHRSSTDDSRYRGAGYLPQHTWSRLKHQRYVDAWMPADADLGGPCGMLPLVLHWASLPHRPALMYDFLANRFQALPQELLMNGSMAEIKQGFLLAAAEGRSQWQQFRRTMGEVLPSDWRIPVSFLEAELQDQLDQAGCNLGSHRVWTLGGWTSHDRSTYIE